jgi:SAM-dependent MidA family methyltransferase
VNVAQSAPGRDERWESSEPQLVAAIRDEIRAAPGQRITFARFMERALAEPGIGYYASSELRPTRGGDFLTAPELHPFFGHCLARFIEGAWRRAGSPSRYLVREYGAGRGALRESAVAGLLADGSALAGSVDWQAVDLPGRTAATDEPADLALANEYLDALPVHRLRRAGGLREAWVGWQEGWFAEILAEPSDAALEAHLVDDGIELREGQRAEICLAAPRWVTEVAGTLRQGGLLLVVDYGHEAAELYGPRRMAGSLLTYRGHAVADDPFVAVGRSDITAHVDVSALRRAADDAGLAHLGHTTQARFLAALGLGELLAALGRDAATGLSEYVDARSAVARFLDPRHLGAFAVLAWGRDVPPGPPLPGFDAAG